MFRSTQQSSQYRLWSNFSSVTLRRRRLALGLDEAQAGLAASVTWTHRLSPQKNDASGYGWSAPYRLREYAAGVRHMPGQ